MANQIPGVYSEVDASAAVAGLDANEQVICIIATGTSDDTILELTNKAYVPYSLDDAIEKYGNDSNIVKLMSTTLANGGKRFIIVRVDDVTVPATPDYVKALEIAEYEEAIDIVIFDSTNPLHHTLLKNHNKTTSENRKERIAFVGFAAGTDMATVTTKAKELNTGQVFTFHPNVLDVNGDELSGIYGAAALAGQVAAELDPSMPMTNVQLNGFYGLATKLKDTEMETLIDSGVIPLETRNGVIKIVRCISTYTKNAEGQDDITWQEITTVRITHHIFKDMREMLTNKYSRARQTKDTRDNISSDVLSKLLEYQGLEYIENVVPEDVTIMINPLNPLRNDVDFKYDVTGPLNVIYLTGHLVI